MGELGKKSFMLRLGVGLDCASFSFELVPPFVLSAAFSPLCAVLEVIPLELRE